MDKKINRLLDTKMLKVSNLKPQKLSATKESGLTDENEEPLETKKIKRHKK
jgi:hypothetical protein